MGWWKRFFGLESTPVEHEVPLRVEAVQTEIPLRVEVVEGRGAVVTLVHNGQVVAHQLVREE